MTSYARINRIATEVYEDRDIVRIIGFEAYQYNDESTVNWLVSEIIELDANDRKSVLHAIRNLKDSIDEETEFPEEFQRGRTKDPAKLIEKLIDQAWPMHREKQRKREALVQ